MSDHASHVPMPSVGRHRAAVSDRVPSAPAFTASVLTGTAVGGGWLLTSLGQRPALGIGEATAAAVGVLCWAAARSRSARRNAADIRAERDAALKVLNEVITAVDQGVQELRRSAGQVLHETESADVPPVAPRAPTGDVLVDALHRVKDALTESRRTVTAVATRRHQALTDQADLAAIFKFISPRLQSLVVKTISAISEVEKPIEDPLLLAGLLRVDHLLTQIRREAESLAVLGGITPSPTSPPVLVTTAIRLAVQEISDYRRVRVQLPRHKAVALPGYVIPNVVHLFAALMENATTYSPASEKVEVFTHQHDGGISVEIRDRGVGMSDGKQDSLNHLLREPASADLRDLIAKKELGLLVAARLAHRHKITITLRPNLVGGTEAIVLLPSNLLVSPDTPGPRRTPADASPAPRTGPVRPAQTTPPGPDGVVRPAQTTPPGPDGELPRRVRRVPASQGHPATGPARDGDRPPLPQRSGMDARLPPLTPQAPAGRPTGPLLPGSSPRPAGSVSDTPRVE